MCEHCFRPEATRENARRYVVRRGTWVATALKLTAVAGVLFGTLFVLTAGGFWLAWKILDGTPYAHTR